MLSIFDFTNYREFLNTWIESQKNKIKGPQGRLAKAANISSSLMSMVLSNEKHLNLEQAAEIAEYIGLTDSETDYFYLLIEAGRAGTHKLKKQLNARIEEQRKRLGNRIKQNIDLSNEIKSIYYSSWAYTGIRNYTATPGSHDVQSIAERFNISTTVAGEILNFLISHGLCKIENELLTYGPKKIHVHADSPFVNKHHQNWRIKALQKMEERKANDLFFTSPMSLSSEAAEKIKTKIPQLIEEIMEISGPSDSEIVRCLNIDWFEY